MTTNRKLKRVAQLELRTIRRGVLDKKYIEGNDCFLREKERSGLALTAGFVAIGVIVKQTFGQWFGWLRTRKRLVLDTVRTIRLENDGFEEANC